MYQIKFKDCDKIYIGETKRNVGTRINEHSSYVKKKKDTVITNHISENKTTSNKYHEFDFDNFKIIDRETNETKRKISEMLLIKNTKIT